MLCNTLVLWGWSHGVINPDVSSAGTCNSTTLLQGYRTGPGYDSAGIALCNEMRLRRLCDGDRLQALGVR